jgi:hypothetical protein
MFLNKKTLNLVAEQKPWRPGEAITYNSCGSKTVDIAFDRKRSLSDEPVEQIVNLQQTMRVHLRQV